MHTLQARSRPSKATRQEKIPQLDPRNIYWQFKAILKTAKLPLAFVSRSSTRLRSYLGFTAPSSRNPQGSEAPAAPPRGFISDIKMTRETEYCVYTLFGFVHIDFMSGTFDHRNLDSAVAHKAVEPLARALSTLSVRANSRRS
jgi:hypothetical protein